MQKLPALIALTLALASCGFPSSKDHPQHTEFLKSSATDLSSRIPRLPFDHAWRNPDADFSKYTHIVVRPVTTRYLQSDNWQASKSPLIPDRGIYQSQASQLAAYWNRSLKHQFSAPICSYYITDSTSRPNTLVLEVALTGLTFGHPADRETKTRGARPMAAFEARLTDAATGIVLASASDHRELPLNPGEFSPDSFTRPNKTICDEWSIELMQATNKEIFEKVRRN